MVMRRSFFVTLTLVGMSALVCQCDSTMDNNMKVLREIEALEAVIVPPVGTTKEEIDSIYGQALEIRELVGKGSPMDYPMHTYQLLPPGEQEQFRAYLYITYRNGKVRKSGIKHFCVVEGRYIPQSDPRWEEEQREIAEENQKRLADLREIVAKFGDSLRFAGWNKGKVPDAR